MTDLKVGDRVRLNDEGRGKVLWNKLQKREGVVVRLLPHCLIAVLWDDRESIDKWDYYFLEKVPHAG